MVTAYTEQIVKLNTENATDSIANTLFDTMLSCFNLVGVIQRTADTHITIDYTLGDTVLQFDCSEDEVVCEQVLPNTNTTIGVTISKINKMSELFGVIQKFITSVVKPELVLNKNEEELLQLVKSASAEKHGTQGVHIIVTKEDDVLHIYENTDKGINDVKSCVCIQLKGSAVLITRVSYKNGVLKEDLHPIFCLHYEPGCTVKERIKHCLA